MSQLDHRPIEDTDQPGPSQSNPSPIEPDHSIPSPNFLALSSAIPLPLSFIHFSTHHPPNTPSLAELKAYITPNQYDGGGIYSISYFLQREIEWAIWEEAHKDKMDKQLFDRLHDHTLERIQGQAEHEGLSGEALDAVMEQGRGEWRWEEVMNEWHASAGTGRAGEEREEGNRSEDAVVEVGIGGDGRRRWMRNERGRLAGLERG